MVTIDEGFALSFREKSPCLEVMSFIRCSILIELKVSLEFETSSNIHIVGVFSSNVLCKDWDMVDFLLPSHSTQNPFALE